MRRLTRAPILRSAAVVAATALCVSPVHARQPQQQQPKDQSGWPCVGKVDPSYIRLAESSGGKVLMFQPGELAGAAADVLASGRHDQLVFRAVGQLADEAAEYAIPIDSTIESAYFTLSLQCLQSATLVRPSGEELRVDAPDVDYNGFQAMRLFVVKAPAPGVWRVKVAGRGFLSVIVAAKSELRFSAAVVESGVPIARAAHAREAAASRSPRDRGGHECGVSVRLPGWHADPVAAAGARRRR